MCLPKREAANMSDEGNVHEEPVPTEEPAVAAPPPPEPPTPSPAVPAAEEPAPTYVAPPPPPPPPPYAAPAEVLPTRPGPATDSSKLMAALGYLFPIIAIIVLFIEPYKDEKFVKFHAVQALAVGVLYIAAGAIAWIPIIGWVLWIVPLVLAIMGLIKAFQGEYWEMPVVFPLIKNFVGE